MRVMLPVRFLGRAAVPGISAGTYLLSIQANTSASCTAHLGLYGFSLILTRGICFISYAAFLAVTPMMAATSSARISRPLVIVGILHPPLSWSCPGLPA